MAQKSINIRIDEELLARIDQAATAQGMDRSAFIRSSCIAALPRSSDAPDLVDQIMVVDERARQVIKDVLSRVTKLENHCFGSTDPFDA